ncbi:MAG: glycosyltransferase family 4 protein [Solirubrobacterales bacterium]
MTRPLRVGINARMGGGVHGGIEQVVVGLADGLSKLEDGDEDYLFLTQPGHDEWLRPHIGGPCRIAPVGGRRPERPADYPARALEWWAPRLRWGWWRRRWPPPSEGHEAGLAPREDGFPSLQLSDGALELAGADLVHFPFQGGFLTRLPTIYQPHDLQHLHLPELFPAGERASRELRYRTYCDQAELVVMNTSWGARDLVERYGLPPSKVAVVNWGSVASLFPDPAPADLAETRARLSLPDEFVLYPAQTWPHKNHERLLEALARIRDRDGIAVPLVCPGLRNEGYAALERRVAELGLEREVFFLGFVEPLELRCLYSLARALVFPSRFEGWGMPVTEAFSLGLPVAAAAATGTPDVVADAGLLFDPDDVEQIADAVLRLWTDADLRRTLARRGAARADALSIDRAVRVFRAHYRRIGGCPLSAEDTELLERPPLA